MRLDKELFGFPFLIERTMLREEGVGSKPTPSFDLKCFFRCTKLSVLRVTSTYSVFSFFNNVFWLEVFLLKSGFSDQF